MAEDLCLCRRAAPMKGDLHESCLGQIWLFDGLPHDAWRSFAGNLSRRRFSDGESLFRQGDEADTMWLLKAGSVKLWKAMEDGRVLTLDLRRAGDLLGENVLMEERGEYPVSATSIGATVTCALDRRTFEAIVTSHPSVGLVVIRNLSRRIDQLSGKVGALSEISLEDRLFEVLVNVARDAGRPSPGGWTLAFPLTHEEIGFLVGAHRLSVTRALGRLREAGRLRMEGRFIVLSDAASPA